MIQRGCNAGAFASQFYPMLVPVSNTTPSQVQINIANVLIVCPDTCIANPNNKGIQICLAGLLLEHCLQNWLRPSMVMPLLLVPTRTRQQQDPAL